MPTAMCQDDLAPPTGLTGDMGMSMGQRGLMTAAARPAAAEKTGKRGMLATTKMTTKMSVVVVTTSGSRPGTTASSEADQEQLIGMAMMVAKTQGATTAATLGRMVVMMEDGEALSCRSSMRAISIGRGCSACLMGR